MEAQKASDIESSASLNVAATKPGLKTWIRVGAIAAATALVGGVAAAWYYRKTLNTFREVESQGEIPDSGIPESEMDGDI